MKQCQMQTTAVHDTKTKANKLSLAENEIEELFDASIPFIDTIKKLISPHIGPFKVSNAHILKLDGNKTEDQYLVIHNSDEEEIVPIDAVAVFIDLHEELTPDSLEVAYKRSQEIKAIPKSDVQGPPDGDIAMTVCIVLARSSLLALEAISEQMGEINNTIPSHKWPDAVAVLSSGILNYTANIPAHDSSGDFYLPTQDYAESAPAPSVFVHKTIRAGGKSTINKVLALIIPRLAIFLPSASASLPNYNDFLEDFPSHGITTQTYQFNLSNDLIPMTHEQALAAQLPTDSFNIVSEKQKLGSVQFQKWQDGGVFVVRGAFPMDLFLVFLREVVPNIDASGLQFFRNSETQVSYVLPMGEKEFFQTLDIFQQRSSNIRIERETAKILLQKTEDEGTSSPFSARLMFGIIKTRDIAFYDKEGRNKFDDLYEPVISNFRNARETAQDIRQKWEDHKEKLASGDIVDIQGRTVKISESLDRPIKRDLESFINLSVRTIKQSMQNLTKELEVDIGFLFKKETTFQDGLKKLQTSDPALADYITGVRQWSEPLILIRNNDLEHGDFPPPRVTYNLDALPVTAEEPEINGKPITEFTDEIIDCISCFVEEVTTHCLQRKFPKGVDIKETTLAERSPENPLRFVVTVVTDQTTPWKLTAHTSKFEDV